MKEKKVKKRKVKLIREDYEGQPDIVYTFHLLGNVPSKKNRYRFSRAGRMFSDGTFTKWHKQAMAQLEPHVLSGWFAHTKEVEILYTFESQRSKDLSNVTESIMDLLVDVGILKDDNFKIVPRLVLSAQYIKGMSKTEIRIKI